MTKWLPFATWKPFPTGITRNHLQMTPVLRRVMQKGEKVAKQPGKACRAGHDVTLSSAFNAYCSVYRVDIIALFAI
jgi:hypothetical protein